MSRLEILRSVKQSQIDKRKQIEKFMAAACPTPYKGALKKVTNA